MLQIKQFRCQMYLNNLRIVPKCYLFKGTNSSVFNKKNLLTIKNYTKKSLIISHKGF